MMCIFIVQSIHDPLRKQCFICQYNVENDETYFTKFWILTLAIDDGNLLSKWRLFLQILIKLKYAKHFSKIRSKILCTPLVPGVA